MVVARVAAIALIGSGAAFTGVGTTMSNPGAGGRPAERDRQLRRHLG